MLGVLDCVLGRRLEATGGARSGGGLRSKTETTMQLRKNLAKRLAGCAEERGEERDQNRVVWTYAVTGIVEMRRWPWRLRRARTAAWRHDSFGRERANGAGLQGFK